MGENCQSEMTTIKGIITCCLHTPI